MRLDELQDNWNRLGQSDPMWAVLTDPSKKGGKWDAAEFFRTGEDQIAGLMARLGDLGIAVGRQTALDFGCGLGRLTQALAGRFEEVHGVDIAPSMIEQARSFSRFRDRCRYHINPRADLALFEDGKFDFVCSFIVLQHIPPDYVSGYLHEFARILKPGGVAVFQLIEPNFLRGLIPQSLVNGFRKLKHRGRSYIPAFGLPRRRIGQVLATAELRTERLTRTRIVGHLWNNLEYIVSKPPR